MLLGAVNNLFTRDGLSGCHLQSRICNHKSKIEFDFKHDEFIYTWILSDEKYYRGWEIEITRSILQPPDTELNPRKSFPKKKTP